MINMIKLDYVPSCCAWVHRSGAPVPKIAMYVLDLYVDDMYAIGGREGRE